jgi:hypothetical protein
MLTNATIAKALELIEKELSGLDDDDMDYETCQESCYGIGNSNQ